MIAVSYHDRVNVLQGAKLAPAGPFARPEWFGLLQDMDGKTPLIATANDGDAMAALPLQRQDGMLQPLANWYSFTWRPLVSEGAPALPLLTAIAAELKRTARSVTLRGVPDEDGSASMLEQAFKAAGWIVLRSICDSNHVLHVGGRSYADYLASRPGKMRTTLKRKAKKVEVELLTIFHDDAWDIYEDIYNNSWKPEEGNPAMLRRFAQQEGDAGRLRMAIARHDGKPVAAQFWTVESGTAYIHKLAHLEDAKPLSAGTTLTAALFEQVIDRDHVELVDFGTGNDGYKADWMEEVRPRYQLDCHNPLRPASWPKLVRAMAARLVTRPAAG